MTSLISSSSEAGVMIFLVSLVTPMKNHRSGFSGTSDEKSHAQFHVTLIYKVTLDSYSVELYLFDIRDPKNLRNKKKDHRSSVTRTRVRKGHAQFHVTLSYKVTLDSYSVDLYLFDIRDPKNLRNKKRSSL